MQNWQAGCDDGWKSKTVQADSIDDATDMLTEELALHVREVHSMDLPKDPVELHKSVVEHVSVVS